MRQSESDRIIVTPETEVVYVLNTIFMHAQRLQQYKQNVDCYVAKNIQFIITF